MDAKNSVQIGVRLPSRTIEKIDRIVADGKALNRADYVRNVVRKELELVE